MDIYQTLIVAEGDSFPSLCDTILFDGSLWLVPKWIAAPELGWRVPERLILLDLKLKDKKLVPPHFVASLIVPKRVLFGPPSPVKDSVFVVIHKPSIPVVPDILQ